MLNNSQRAVVRVWTSEGNKKFPGNNIGHISIETPNNYMSLWPIPFSAAQRLQYLQLLSQIQALEGKPKNQENNYLKLQMEHKKFEFNQVYLKYYLQREANFRQTYQHDYVAENHTPPQVTLCFYSLDTDRMENEFGKLVKNTQGWRLIGSNYFIQEVEQVIEKWMKWTLHSKTLGNEVGCYKVDNCASLVLKILKAGGIGKLVDISQYSTFSLKTSSTIKPDDALELLIPAKLAELEKYQETRFYQTKEELNPAILKEKIQQNDISCLIIQY